MEIINKFINIVLINVLIKRNFKLCKIMQNYSFKSKGILYNV
jgi:hypothetical protein